MCPASMLGLDLWAFDDCESEVQSEFGLEGDARGLRAGAFRQEGEPKAISRPLTAGRGSEDDEVRPGGGIPVPRKHGFQRRLSFKELK